MVNPHTNKFFISISKSIRNENKLYFFFTIIHFAQVTIDENGWAEVSPAPNSKIVYVISSVGNHINNDGFYPNHPVQTLAAAYALLRDGYPD